MAVTIKGFASDWSIPEPAKAGVNAAAEKAIGVERPTSLTFSTTVPAGTSQPLTPTSPVTWRGGTPLSTSNGIVSTIGGPIGVEFLVWGKTVSIRVHCYSDTNRLRILVDGKLITARNGDLIQGAAVNARIWVTLTFATDGPHRVYANGVNLAWHSLGHDATGDIASPLSLVSARKTAVVGDSWVGGAAGVSSMNTWAAQIGEFLGLPDFQLAGQGGTGYVNVGPAAPGTKTFGDSGRLNPVIAAKPTDVVVFGSINDGDSAPATIKANAKAMYAALRAGIPGVRIHVVLPQPTTVGQQSSTKQIANRQAVKDAALESAGIYTIVDGVADGWLTEGNRARFLATDQVHLTQEGHDYLARRLATALRPGMLDTAVAFTPVPEAPPAPTALAADTFSRADGTLGTTETGARTWSVSGTGRIEVTGNVAMSYDQTGTSLRGGFALVDVETPNVVVELTHVSGGSGVGPAVRCAPDQGGVSSTGYFLQAQAGVWNIYKRTGQTAFTIIGASTTAPAAGQIARLEVAGDTFTAKINGNVIATATDSTYTSNLHGFTSAYHMKAVDNFTVRAL